jgi:hypothetical protein
MLWSLVKFTHLSEALRSSEMLTNFHQTTQPYNAEDSLTVIIVNSNFNDEYVTFVKALYKHRWHTVKLNNALYYLVL